MRIRTSCVAATAVFLAIAPTGEARAQAKAFMESATYAGTGDTVVLQRVPVRNGSGVVAYKDVTIPFTVDSSGTLTAGTPTVTASPVLLTGKFVAGKYTNGTNVFYLTGPGVGTGGRTTWSLETSECGVYHFGWTTGPIAGHPMQARLKTAGITYAGVSYGTGGGGDGGSCYKYIYWGSGVLVGASGSPNGLTLQTFSYNGSDYPTPTETMALRYCVGGTC